MLVNNINISTFKATLLSKDIQTAEIIIYDDWLRNALDPSYLGKKEKYKPVKIKLLIEDTNEDSALNDISNLIKQLEKCVIKFDDLSFYYSCTITNKKHEQITIGRYTLDVELKSGYAYKDYITEIASRIASKTINIPSNQETQAIVEITPSIDLIDIVVNGLSKDPIVIKNLKQGQKVIINGEDGTVTCNGINKYGDTDLWNFPKLVPGANTLSFSQSNCDITIKYRPRWI